MHDGGGKISGHIVLGKFFGVLIPFRCAFSVDTHIRLPYTFLPRSSTYQRKKLAPSYRRKT
jgi:hypothetical protein